MRFSKFLRFRTAALGAGRPVPGSRPPAPAGDGPAWWEVRIRLETQGRYALARDATDFDGEYAYEALWTGQHGEGRPRFPPVPRLPGDRPLGVRGAVRRGRRRNRPLRKGFPRAPGLSHELRPGRSTAGSTSFSPSTAFPCPGTNPPRNFALVLPCSRKESAASTEAGYDGAVLEGSNDVSLDEKELRKGPVKRVFRWSWKRYEASSAPPPAGPFFSGHEVKVTVIDQGGPRERPSGPGVELVVNLTEPVAADVGIDLGRRDLAVPEHELDGPEVRAALEEVGGEGMPQDVRADLRGDPGLQGVALEELPETLPGERASPPGEEERRGRPLVEERARPVRYRPGPPRRPPLPGARYVPCRPCPGR